MGTTATTHLIRRLNSSAVLDLIREQSPIAQSQISRQLNISLPTVQRIVEDLIEEDLVRWSGDLQASGGRPRRMLEFNHNGYAVIGLDLGGTKLFGTISDLGGQIQAERYMAWQENSPEACLDQVKDLIDDLLSSPRPDDQKVLGIGIGAPGITYFEEGVVAWAPSLGWRDLPLKELLNQRFHLPVIVENDVNLAAMGEYSFGAGRGTTSMVCITVGTGIGAGIVFDRKIYRGHNHSAGEIGYLPTDIACMGQKYEGFGALESLASGLGIEKRAIKLFNESNWPIPADGLSAENIFQNCREGEAWAKKLVDETIDYLSMAIAAIGITVDPEIIVIGGGVSNSADLLIPGIHVRLDGVIPVRPNLVVTDLGSRAAVMGAISLVLDMTTERIALSSI
jgi:glucokinase-like ROK family protein